MKLKILIDGNDVIKGKIYPVVRTTDDEYVIIDEAGDDHYWTRGNTDYTVLADDHEQETFGAIGEKYDEGKNRMGLYLAHCTTAVKAVSDVLTFGANKYSANGWRTVPNAKERYTDALYRHLNAYHAGEEFDEESGLSHLAHAATNIAFLIELDAELTEC